MNYICAKAMRLNGVDYVPGDTIPENVFRSGRARTLKTFGYISEIGDGEPVADKQPVSQLEEVTIKIPIKAENGSNMEVELTHGELLIVFADMQMTVEECTAEVAKEENEKVLIILHSVDSRKGVKQAAKSRAIELSNNNDKDGAQGGDVVTDGSTGNAAGDNSKKE